MGNFDFIEDVFPPETTITDRHGAVSIFNRDDFAAECATAESYIYSSPGSALTHMRNALEQLLSYLHVGVYDRGDYRYGVLQHTDLYYRIKDLEDEVPAVVINKMDTLRDAGNNAVHANDGTRKKRVPVTTKLAESMMVEFFHVVIWAGLHASPNPGNVPANAQFSVAKAKANMAFNAEQSKLVVANAKKLLTERDQRIKEQGDQLAAQREENQRQQKELEELREQIRQAQATAKPDTHDYTYGEAETRAVLIDAMLAEQGWKLGGKGLPDSSPETKGADATIEVPVEGMPVTPAHPSGKGFADYVLWGDDGRPLAVVEAKSARVGVESGLKPALNQARAYADCLERQYGRRPVIFATSGYETAIWDQWTDADGHDAGYVSRPVQGFYKKNELERLLARRPGLAGNERTQRKELSTEPISTRVAGRPYQIAAIKTVDDAFDSRRRGALLVMATGTGKTRVAIALIEQLMKANWVQNVLFLADRTALVNQAANAFKKKDTGLGATAPIVNLLDTKERGTAGSIYLSTYQTMMNLINARDHAETDDGTGAGASASPKNELRFGPGFFDLIVIDEAHRSVYAKYGFIFEYFDALRVGLTATPRHDVDRNTYGLFGINPDDLAPENSAVPGLYSYSFDEAVQQGYLVPARGRKVETAFMREGATYDELSDDEKAQWDALDWSEDGEVPDEVDANDINRVLFNNDTIDKVLGELMEHGIHVDEGDRIGKTIIFARNQRHADAIKERFDISFADQYGDRFAQVITHRTRNAQSLIEDFSDPNKMPQVAISVDMLDTGVDVPEVVNLVFFKPVMSATKYWQMVGRGTRLCRGLFAPDGQPVDGHREFDKSEFLIIDCCGNLEYFQQNLPEKPSHKGMSMRERLNRLRIGLLETVDAGRSFDSAAGAASLRTTGEGAAGADSADAAAAGDAGDAGEGAAGAAAGNAGAGAGAGAGEGADAGDAAGAGDAAAGAAGVGAGAGADGDAAAPCHPEEQQPAPCHPERADASCHPERAERVEGSHTPDATATRTEGPLSAFGGDADSRARYRDALAGLLGNTVGGMDPDHDLLARPHRRAIETMHTDGWWNGIDAAKASIAATVAGLNSSYRDPGEAVTAKGNPAVRNSAYGFDYLMLSYELGVLRAAAAEQPVSSSHPERAERAEGPHAAAAEGNRVNPDGSPAAGPAEGAGGGWAIAESNLAMDTVRRKVRATAENLLQKRLLAIPDVAACRELLEAIAGDEWWQDVTVPMLETARKRLRGIVHYAKAGGLNPVYTDFQDTLDVSEEVAVSTASAAVIDMRRFRDRARAFLQSMSGNIALARLRTGRPLTAQDLDELGRLLVEAGVGSADEVAAAAQETEGGFGMFIRSLVGLDRAAVEETFSQFLEGKRYKANQIAFIKQIVDELTATGEMKPERLYEDPFSELAGDGPEKLLGEEPTAEICSILDRLNASAAPVGGAADADDAEDAAGAVAA